MKAVRFIFAFCIAVKGLAEAFMARTPIPLRRYLQAKPQSDNRASTTLFDISEWRDLMFDFPGTGTDRRLGTEQGAPPKEICILPFPYTEVLLQGETKQLRLYEDRFIKLFDDAMKNHCGIVAMGLLAESGIIQIVSLCEIEAFNRMDGFGIFVTIRSVSRAQLIEINQQEPYIKAICTELNDNLPPNFELPNLVASNIENTMLMLSSMEHRLEQARKNKNDDDTEDEEDLEMQRRINVAKLDDRFYELEADIEDDEEEENIADHEEGDDTEDTFGDRRSRFQKAYECALATDTQGYRVIATDETAQRTPQELTAVSWAAFCTEILPEIDATYRIQALDCDDLFDRLKLALHMLREKKAQLRAKMEKSGLSMKGDDGDMGGNSDDKGEKE